MKKGTKILIGAAASLALIMTPVVASAAEYTGFGASCSNSGNSHFTATKRGLYTYVWRTGSTVNGGGIVYLRSGQEFSVDTPDGTSTSTRFGVLTTSTTFGYVTCGA